MESGWVRYTGLWLFENQSESIARALISTSKPSNASETPPTTVPAGPGALKNSARGGHIVLNMAQTLAALF